MYTFKDKGDRSITLRPEGTAAVVRSYIENKMQGEPNQPIKLYYNGLDVSCRSNEASIMQALIIIESSIS